MAPGRVPMANQSLIAHELAHMWFPMIVGNNETRCGWQDEGLVEFFTAILEREFWQRTRPGAIRELAATQALGLDKEPMLRHADHLEHTESYVLLCYTKPCAVLQQLAGLFGEDRVVAALRDYARAWQFLHPEPEDFFAMMNAGLGEDLGWYWSTWWTTTWRLDHAIGAVEVTDGEAASTKVTIHDLGRAPHPVVVRATFADGSTAERTVPVATWLGGKVTAEVTFEGAAARVELDPEARTVDCDRANNVWTNDK
jgi:aminopeptidase N